MKKHGRGTIRVNGQVYETEDNATLKVGGIKNSVERIGQKTYHSQTETVSELVCTFPATVELSMRGMGAITDAEIIFESDVGISYIMRNACQVGEPELSGGDNGGKPQFTFQGDPAEEMVV